MFVTYNGNMHGRAFSTNYDNYMVNNNRNGKQESYPPLITESGHQPSHRVQAWIPRRNQTVPEGGG